MSTLEQVADTHLKGQQELARRSATRAVQIWRRLDPNNIAGSWRSLLPVLLNVVATSQETAAASASGYVDDALAAQRLRAPAEGRLLAGGLAGVASDGRALESLLYQPAVRTLVAIGQGATVTRALAGGSLALDTIVRTQVADAGRVAEAVSIASRPRVHGYVRMLSLPSCSRCIILAGRRYEWNAGFRRHPRCDCRHIPAGENLPGDTRTDPKKLFESMSSAEQDRIFTKAGAEAVRMGADLNQVVNARRGMETATVFGRQVLHTREGVTRKGRGGRRLNAKRRVRLMPEQIFLEAAGDREEAVRLLRLHGYIS
jgi:hypothetical protein